VNSNKDSSHYKTSMHYPVTNLLSEHYL